MSAAREPGDILNAAMRFHMVDTLGKHTAISVPKFLALWAIGRRLQQQTPRDED